MQDALPRSARWALALAALNCLTVFTAVGLCNRQVLETADHLVITGGGFIFNYRIADIRAGITVGTRKPLPETSRMEVTFHLPGAAPIVMDQPPIPYRLNYTFETASLSGIEPEMGYLVELNLMRDEQTLEHHEKILKTGVAPKAMPTKPLTLGPGYTPNPEAWPPK
ncbi:hypothetical protein [Roseibium aestuarii]|uniref:Uncharacterized protein n=1 Tax=Roseibium aestuarii TaxID=2600299 RepID=A0ABW4K217_9HYPH|nr:hypothetical protein [Roseibium aestuarii]